jgi:DNA-binding response OmpR family regulator
MPKPVIASAHIAEWLDYAGASVLMVDDEQNSIRVTAEVMKHFGLQVSYAATPAAAYSMMQLIMPEVVITDLMFPHENADGFDLLELIGRSEHTKLLPVIVYSALDADQAAPKAYAMGAACYVRKPMDSGGILARVVSAVHRYRTAKKLILKASGFNFDT